MAEGAVGRVCGKPAVGKTDRIVRPLCDVKAVVGEDRQMDWLVDLPTTFGEVEAFHDSSAIDFMSCNHLRE